MGRFVDGPQALAGEVGVDLGRRQIGVAEQLLHGPQVGSAFQQVRSVRVPEGVGVQGPPVGQRMALHDAAGVAGAERAGRAGSGTRRRAGESGVSSVRTALARATRASGVDGRGAERHPPDLGSLAEHGDGPLAEVDVAGVEPAALGDPHAGAVEHLEHGEVAEGDGAVDGIGLEVASSSCRAASTRR